MSRRVPEYEVRFDHIGRHKPLPLRTKAGSLDILGNKIYKYADRFLASREVCVQISEGGFSGKGQIFAGDRMVGNFTWTIQAPTHDSYGTSLRPGAHPEGLDDL